MTRPRRILSAAVVVSVFAVVPAVTVGAQPADPAPTTQPRTQTRSTDTPTDAPIAAAAPVRIVALNRSALSVQGVASPGDVELVPTARSTVRVIRVTTVGDWLRSLAPGPAGGQEVAAEAQAVVWRSYALRRVDDGGGRSSSGTADVCSHVDCPLGEQVSVVATDGTAGDTTAGDDASGGPSTVPADPAATRWADALRATRDEILAAGTKPALARSHALAGGTTRRNDAVFADGNVPYLPSVDVKEDEAAAGATSQWSAVLPLADVERQLRAAGLQVPAGLSEVRSIGTVEDPQVALVGDGAEVRVAKTDFADALDAVLAEGTTAPEALLTPARDRTVPSYRYSVTTSDGDVTIEGVGDGHGVGMSATAALAQAAGGGDVDAVLSRFYPGTSTVEQPEADATPLRVEVAELPVVTLDSTRGFRIIEAGGGTVVESALLEWTARVADPPTGTDAGVLAFAGPEGAGAELRISEFSSPLQGTAGTGVPVAFVLTRPAFVTATLVDAGGAESTAALRDGAVFPAGRSTAVVPIATPGTWKIRLVADDRSATARTETQSLAVEERRRGPSPTGALALAALLTGLVIVTLAGRASLKRRRAAGT